MPIAAISLGCRRCPSRATRLIFSYFSPPTACRRQGAPRFAPERTPGWHAAVPEARIILILNLSGPPAPSMTALDPTAQQLAHALYRDHHGWLQGWLRKKLGCAFDAADLVHDTYARVLAHRELSGIHEPRSYLATVAHGLMVNHLQRKDLERAYLETLARLPASAAPSPEARALALEALQEIDTLLDGLPAAVRRAFLLCQLEGLTHAEIAARLHVSVGSVRQYIARALRQCLELAA